MGGLKDSVKNGPAIKSATRARIEARIELAEQRAKTAERRATEASRRAAKGNGPLAWYRRQEAEAHKTVAEQRRHEADQLRTKLAKAKAAETAKQEKHIKRTVASTAAAGLIPGPSQARQAQPVGQRGQPGRARPEPSTPTKGTTVTAGTGEAVSLEQTEAFMASLRSDTEAVRGRIDIASNSLASRGLTEFAGEFAAADDHLDGLLSTLDKADERLADQKAIQEAAQAAGEMADPEFYGA
jgi:hypothetical protein